MKKVLFFAASAAMVFAVLNAHLEPSSKMSAVPGHKSIAEISLSVPKAHAATCFKQSEYTSGMNKICIYRCVQGEAAITISSVSLCPLTIER